MVRKAETAKKSETRDPHGDEGDKQGNTGLDSFRAFAAPTLIHRIP